MDPFIGEIKMFGGNFAPIGWAFCDGQLLSINSNTALFSILGTTYGGDGRTTFALPDLRGRAPIHAGHGPGLSFRSLGARSGSEYNVLNQSQLPSHSHTATGTLRSSDAEGTVRTPGGNYIAGNASNRQFTPAASGTMATNSVEVTIGNTGNNLSVNNMQPWLAVNYIIATLGAYPSRS